VGSGDSGKMPRIGQSFSLGQQQIEFETRIKGLQQQLGFGFCDRGAGCDFSGWKAVVLEPEGWPFLGIRFELFGSGGRSCRDGFD
jgi:hypothetical protein